ncbi:MAG: hypothetical protein RMJ05_06895 [Thermomicrobium sp.]|nr:hypothetical protein [Thermomicrobium sp.]MDW8059992.1 hypothetical protein [Thermomicrobium sp.]
MPRASIAQRVQIGVETTPGTAVPANRLLQALGIEKSIEIESAQFKPAGFKFPTISVVGKEWTEAELSGTPTYTELVYPLASILGYQAPTQLNPPTGTAYEWIFEPKANAPDTVKTFTVEQGDGTTNERFTYGLVTEFGMNISREEIEIEGTMLGKRIERVSSLTANPTAIRLEPILPTQISVYLDTSHTALGTTKIRPISIEWKISDRFSPLWVLDSDIDSFAAVNESEPDTELNLLIEADNAGMALLDTMRQGAKAFLRIKALGPTIEGATKYEFTMDACIVVSDSAEFSDEDGTYAIQWACSFAYDQGWGKVLSIKLVNDVSGL